MNERLELYRCPDCGEIVEIIRPGAFLICCGKLMKKIKTNRPDASKEKHLPVVRLIEGGVEVALGAVTHPMEDKHFIEWIELVTDRVSFKQFLKPGDEPKPHGRGYRCPGNPH